MKQTSLSFQLSISPILIIFTGSLILLYFFPALAKAEQTYEVNKIADTDDGTCDNDCSLREAIIAANNTAGTDTIAFDLPANSTITLNGTQLPIITDDVNINGSTAVSLTVSGNELSRVFEIEANTFVTMTHLIISNGRTDSNGAGIYNLGLLTLNTTVISGNLAIFSGGGIYNRGTLILNDSTVTSNSSNQYGGGIANSSAIDGLTMTTLNNSTVSGNSSRIGAGIYNSTNSNSINRVIFNNSSLLDNHSTNGNGGLGIFVSSSDSLIEVTLNNSTIAANSTPYNGGGVHIHAHLGQANFTANNSTVSGNSANFSGGGFYNYARDSSSIINLTLNNSVLSDNSANDKGGGIYNLAMDGHIDVKLNNSIVANSVSAEDCFKEMVIDGKGAITVNAQYTLTEDQGVSACGINGASHNIIGQNPKLGPLSDNGGSTLTHILLSNSPAIDAGNNLTCLPADQRGISRPQDGDNDDSIICDLGAVEIETPQVGPHLIVTHDSDMNDGSCSSLHCTLREAIIAANDHTGANTITFDLPQNSTIMLEGEQLPIISDAVIIDGSTAVSLTVSGNEQSRAFEIGAGTVVTITNLAIINGSSSNGGAIYNDGSLLLMDAFILNSKTTVLDGKGGGIFNSSSLTIENTLLAGNSTFTESLGGGIYNSNASLTLTNSTVFDNSAGSGGGIYAGPNTAVTITQSALKNNMADLGGGIFITNTDYENIASLTISNSIFTENTANEGGGIFQVNQWGTAQTVISNSSLSNNLANAGGGIFNYNISDGHADVTINNSTLFSNSATLDEGGGIFNISSSGNANVTLNNSTLSTNTANTNGGGVHNSNFAFGTSTITLNNSTLSGNSATNNGGGLYNDAGILHLRNTIIANSISSEDCFTNTSVLTTNVHNLIEDNSCNPDFSGDPLLKPLGNNGGATLTHALSFGSPAIGKGEEATCLSEDQRNVTRLKGEACDIGAFEFSNITVFLPFVLKP